MFRAARHKEQDQRCFWTLVPNRVVAAQRRGRHHLSKEKTPLADQAFSLITLRTYWEDYQQRLLAAITPLSSEQLALPVASHATIGDLLGHMIGARFNWFHLWMGEEEPAALVEWGTDEDMRKAASLASAFEITW